jgi:hypothetical protein
LKFEKVNNRKVYESWQYRNKYQGVTATILKMPEDGINNEFYHFQVISNAKNSTYKVKYASIDELKIYPTFEDTQVAVEKYWNEILKKSKI